MSRFERRNSLFEFWVDAFFDMNSSNYTVDVYACLEKGWDLEGYVKVCEVGDVPTGTMRPVEVGGKRLMIVNVDGALYALDRICTHEEADLSTGFLVGSIVTCPLHLSRFDVKTGGVDNLPATVPLDTYKLKIEETSVYVQV